MAAELPPLEPMFNPWEDYENYIYQIFMDTVVNGRLRFQGCPVKSQYRPETNGKGFSFWHLISEGKKEEERTPDFRRCERVRWFSWLIENAATCDALCWWENRRGTATHIVIWHEAEKFAVVLAKRNGYFLIKTAYVVKSGRERAFRKERDNFWSSRKD
ncbi:MAG: hypothetical protein H2067_09085 [Alcanivorax sp.]|nr:hypothetical protein [Alcanivorax sp.]